MSRISLAGIAAVGLVFATAGFARAENVSAKKIMIKENADPNKRKVLVLSLDGGVAKSEADNPLLNGASIHLYSANDDLCLIFEAGTNWQDLGTKWKYKNTTTKNSAQIKDGKLLVRLKQGVTFDLADDGSQGTVYAQVQFGNGTRYCMKCSGNIKDDDTKFFGKDCGIATCDTETITCDPFTSTTSSTSTSTTSSTCPPPPANKLKGALTQRNGDFNYNLLSGVPAADAECNDNFSGTHACTYAELQTAAGQGDLVCLKDVGNNTVNSFWAIDSSRPDNRQCNDVNGTLQDWAYPTCHVAQGDRVGLTNSAGTLGSLTSPCCLDTNWIGCCSP